MHRPVVCVHRLSLAALSYVRVYAVHVYDQSQLSRPVGSGNETLRFAAS